MVPWPIALLALFYGVIASASAATTWKAISGVADRSPVWPLAWLALSASLMCGLPLLKPWARTLAMAASTLLVLVTLSMAGLFVMGGQPLIGLLATMGTAVHVIAIRYLQRPTVKAYFGLRNVDCGLKRNAEKRV